MNHSSSCLRDIDRGKVLKMDIIIANRYEVIRHIVKGNFTQVYHVKDQNKQNKEMALKIVKLKGLNIK